MKSVEEIRAQFPILKRKVRDEDLVYLDNAASTQRPQCVIDAVSEFYAQHNANVHRGVHTLSQEATDLYEGAREKVQQFIHAKESAEIIFTRGTTESINLVANSLGALFQEGDEIIISHMEHHSNIVPWQMLCQRAGLVLKVIGMNEKGELDMEDYKELLTKRTKMVAVVHVSNALGTINPIKEIIDEAHKVGAYVLVDGAQATARIALDVQELDVDFYAASGHKMYGPTGIGFLYGKRKLLDLMPPYQGGGDMIASVSFEGTTYAELPAKFEAGTPNIAGAVGLGRAVDFLLEIGLDEILKHEKELLAYATEQVGALEGVHLIGTAEEKTAVLSFLIEDIHPHDVGTIVDTHGVAIRTGHHCAEPIMEFFGIPATARLSLGVFNTEADIDALVTALKDTMTMFRS